MAGPQFYGGPDLQRAGFSGVSPVPAKILPVANQAPHKTEGLPRRLGREGTSSSVIAFLLPRRSLRVSEMRVKPT